MPREKSTDTKSTRKKYSSAYHSNTSVLSAILGLIVIIVVVLGGLYLLELNQNEPPENDQIEPTPTLSSTNVSLVVDSLSPLEDGYYSLWLSSTDIMPFDSEQAVLVGRFNVSEKGNLTDLNGRELPDNELIIDQDLTEMSFVWVTWDTTVTMEVAVPTIVMKGELENGIGSLSFSQADFSQISGNLILATPSDGPDTNESSGVWFVTLSEEGTTESAGLDLPVAPSGWIYQGWVNHQDQFINTGLFSDPNKPDLLADYSGDHEVPLFPGEDFLVNVPEGLSFSFPLDLADGTTSVLITLEPNREPTSEIPSGLNLLETTIEQEAVDHINYALENISDSNLPSGLIVIR